MRHLPRCVKLRVKTCLFYFVMSVEPACRGYRCINTKFNKRMKDKKMDLFIQNFEVVYRDIVPLTTLGRSSPTAVVAGCFTKAVRAAWLQPSVSTGDILAQPDLGHRGPPQTCGGAGPRPRPAAA